jgi:hypothetical protein
MEEILLARRCLWLCLGKRSGAVGTWRTILASPFLDSCKAFRFSKLSRIFCFFDFFISTISIFRFFEFCFFEKKVFGASGPLAPSIAVPLHKKFFLAQRSTLRCG